MEHTSTLGNQIVEALAAWGVATSIGAVQAVAEIHLGKVYKVTDASGKSFALKNIGENSPQVLQRFAFEYDVLCHLDHMGLSVALPIPGQEGELLVLKNGHLYTLSPYLATNNRWLALNLEGLKRLNHNCGAAIAKLHRALAAFPAEDLENRTWNTVFPDDLFEHWIPTIQQHLSPQERKAFDTIVRDTAADMRATMKTLPVQLIHRDCHHGNIIVDGERVSGFIDFDHLSIGPRVFDLADFIVHMIKQHVADQERTAEWFKLFPAVLQGYKEENALLKEEKQALYGMMLGVILIFAGWFFETGRPEQACSELEAFAWMYHNRWKIYDLIPAIQEEN